MEGLETRVTLFGSPSLLSPSGAPGMGPGKPIALLAYLILEGKTQRSELIGLLWGDQTDKNARNAFRQTLHRLRAALSDGLLEANSSDVLIRPDARLWSDVAAFENALKVGNVTEAVRLYGGPLLAGIGLEDGEFGHWLMGRRRQYEARFHGALRTAISSCLQSGDTEAALSHATTLARSAPLDSDAVLIASNAFLTAGRIDEGRSFLEEFVRHYRTEVGDDIPDAVKETLLRLRKHSHAPIEIRSTGREVFRVVGRDAELSRLGAAWTEARGGSGRTIVVEGPEGIGKSALVAEFLRRAEPLGPMLTLAGHERSAGSRLPYASIAGALRGTLTAPGLSGASRHLLAEASRLLPELRDQFDLPEPDRIEGEGSMLRLFEGVAALIDAVAYEQPVCVVLEDFHNAARETTDLLQYLSGRLAGVAVMFLVTARSSATNASPIFGDFERVALGPVSAAAAAKIISDSSDIAVVSPDECARLAALSGGVPYRALELARQVGGGLNPTAIPATLHDALWARLKGFTPAHQRLFLVCALIERPITIRIAAAASHISESAALDAALALEGAGLLTQVSEGIKPAHDFAATIALEGTGPAGRALLAGWAAEALQRVPGTRSGELAYLYNLAGDKPAAFKAAVAAAFEAGAVGSTESASAFLAMATACANTVEEQHALDSARAVFAPQQKRILPGETQGLDSASGANSETDPVDAEPANDGKREGTQPGAGKAEPATARYRQLRRPGIRILAIAGVAVTVAAFAAANRERNFRLRGPVLSDTLILGKRMPGQSARRFYVTGQVTPDLTSPAAMEVTPMKSWIDSLVLPWANPRISPTGAVVAIERIGAGGSEIFVSGIEGLVPRRISVGGGDNIIAGWAPDGTRLLAMRGRLRPDGSYASDLLAYGLATGVIVTLDSANDRSVVDAVWSPDGSHIAWTARAGKTHQQDVFIANADGTGVRNVTQNSAEDYHVAWAPGGRRIVFTSERTGDPELFTYELASYELRRLTWDPAQDDHGVFSPDETFVAFESTRAGTSAVYVTRSWGGTPVKVSSSITGLGVVSWGRGSRSYLDAVKVDVSPWVELGDTVSATASGLDQYGKFSPLSALTWKSLDPAILKFTGRPSSSEDEASPVTGNVIGVGRGIARLVASAPGWRSDTVFVQVGAQTTVLLREDFETGINPTTWFQLGVPSSLTIRGSGFKGTTAFSPNGDRQWESGILSRTTLPLRSGLSAEVLVKAPLSSVTAPTSFNFALVAPERSESVDSIAPRFFTLASVQWIGRAGRLAYGAQQEVWTEPVTSFPAANYHLLRISIDTLGRTAFHVDGILRWRSNLRVRSSEAKAQLWLGGEGTGDAVLFDSVVVTSSPQGRVRQNLAPVARQSAGSR